MIPQRDPGLFRISAAAEKQSDTIKTGSATYYLLAPPDDFPSHGKFSPDKILKENTPNNN